MARSGVSAAIGNRKRLHCGGVFSYFRSCTVAVLTGSSPRQPCCCCSHQ
jgi:hypothetical protein